jgi:hypothetical protein
MDNSFVLRRLGVLATAAVLALGLLTVGTVAQARPALAAACVGSSCDRVDPFTSGCVNDSIVLDQVSDVDQNGNHVVQLMWSRSCNAGWARSTGSYSGRINVAIVRYRCTRSQLGNCLNFVINAQETISMFSGGWTDMLGDTMFAIQAVDVSYHDGTAFFHNGVVAGSA